VCPSGTCVVPSKRSVRGEENRVEGVGNVGNLPGKEKSGQANTVFVTREDAGDAKVPRVGSMRALGLQKNARKKG